MVLFHIVHLKNLFVHNFANFFYYNIIFQACKLPNLQCKSKDSNVEICVPEVLKCDGKFHCQDGSDEENCPNTLRCNLGEFACNDGKQCIQANLKCDQKEDCEDGSDEIIECGNQIKRKSYEYCATFFLMF